MKIGIIGSGTVAQTLGTGLAAKGHQVMLGTRDPSKLLDWKNSVERAHVGTVPEAAAFAALAILAVAGDAAATVMRSTAGGLAGKVVIDTCNPISGPPVDGVLPFFTTHSESLMEKLQRDSADVRFVKAFNSVGSPVMIDPKFNGAKPTMFICGNDAAAKQTVTDLLASVGWDIADMGTAVAARAIEPLCMLWCILGFRESHWTHAFQLLK